MENSIELLEKVKQGDKEARDILVKENTGLVWNVVKRFSSRGYDYDELFQVGVIGLIKAIDYFDLSYQVKLSTYAVPMIMGEIKRFLRNDGMIKVSRQIKENAWKLGKVRDEIASTKGREATVEEMCRLTGLKLEDVLLALDSKTEVESLNKVVYQGEHNEICLMDRIESQSNAHEQLLNRILIHELLEELKPDERNIIILRYFCNQSQAKIAKRLGVSQVQVSRIEKKILKRMREIAME